MSALSQHARSRNEALCGSGGRVMERRACIVAGLDRPELALDLLGHKPKNHGKCEQPAQEDEIHEQGRRQSRFLCNLCTCDNTDAGLLHWCQGQSVWHFSQATLPPELTADSTRQTRDLVGPSAMVTGVSSKLRAESTGHRCAQQLQKSICQLQVC